MSTTTNPCNILPFEIPVDSSLFVNEADGLRNLPQCCPYRKHTPANRSDEHAW